MWEVSSLPEWGIHEKSSQNVMVFHFGSSKIIFSAYDWWGGVCIHLRSYLYEPGLIILNSPFIAFTTSPPHTLHPIVPKPKASVSVKVSVKGEYWV